MAAPGAAEAHPVSSSPSAEPAGPVLPRGGVLHAGAPGGQAPAPHGPEKPPQVLLHGQRPERQDDARPLLLRHRRLRPQEEQPPQRQGRPAAPEPAQALRQEHLQSLLRKAQGRRRPDPPGEAAPGLGGRSRSERGRPTPHGDRAALRSGHPAHGSPPTCPRGCA